MPAGVIQDSQLLAQLKWRYATKRFDPSKKISPEHWATLEEAVRLSASSYGLQPWKFVVANDPALRKRLQAAAFNQPQVVDASHMVIFCYKKTLTEADIDAFLKTTSETRGVPLEKLAGYREVMIGDLVKGPRSKMIDVWTSRQVYIALGTLLTSAAVLGIDACPMEGFVPDQFNEILGVTEKGYSSVAMCTLGYRSAEDHSAGYAKVRFAPEVVFEHR